jgi:hypothetical protein
MFAAAVEKCIVADHKRAGPRWGQARKRAIDVAYGAPIQGMELQSEGMAAGRLQIAQTGAVRWTTCPRRRQADIRPVPAAPLLRGNGRE